MGHTKLISECENLGYSVDKITEHSAVILNDGVASNYSAFDNEVATLAIDNGCYFVCQSDMTKMYQKTVEENNPADEYHIYMGVFKIGRTEKSLKDSDYSFKFRS